MRDEEEAEKEEEAKIIEHGIDAKAWKRWLEARDGYGANLNFNQH